MKEKISSIVEAFWGFYWNKRSEISQRIVWRIQICRPNWLKFVDVLLKSLFWETEGLSKTSLLKLLFQLSAVLYFIQSKIIGARYLSVKNLNIISSFIFLIFSHFFSFFLKNLVIFPPTRPWDVCKTSNWTLVEGCFGYVFYFS